MGEEHDDITDGRILRRQRNREAVLDAVVELFRNGVVDPSIDQVSAQAGVSNRSVYRYFEDRDELTRAAIEHQMHAVIPVLRMPNVGAGSFEQRVAHFVHHRLDVHAQLAPIARAAKLASITEPLIAEQFERGRLMLRQLFIDHFADELAHLPGGEQTRAVLAAEIAFQFETVEFLWESTHGVVSEMRHILVDHLELTIGRLRSTSDA